MLPVRAAPIRLLHGRHAPPRALPGRPRRRKDPRNAAREPARAAAGAEALFAFPPDEEEPATARHARGLGEHVSARGLDQRQPARRVVLVPRDQGRDQQRDQDARHPPRAGRGGPGARREPAPGNREDGDE